MSKNDKNNTHNLMLEIYFYDWKTQMPISLAIVWILFLNGVINSKVSFSISLAFLDVGMICQP